MGMWNLSDFGGKPVADFALGDAGFDVDARTPRLRLEYDADDDDNFAQLVAAYAALPEAPRTQALVVGMWGVDDEDASVAVEALIAYRDRFPDLRFLFVGDIAQDEREISWIMQGDLSPLWPSFRKLEEIGARGGVGLSLGHIRSDALKSLTVEAGALRRQVVVEALTAEAPNLEHLELWTGSEEYGGNCSPDDFEPLMAGGLFPRLKSLALRNCQFTDDLAEALAKSPLLERIETLDLSLGVLSDRGAEALLSSPHVARLKKLNLHRHYLSKEMMARVAALPVEVDLSKQQTAWRDGDRERRSIWISE